MRAWQTGKHNSVNASLKTGLAYLSDCVGTPTLLDFGFAIFRGDQKSNEVRVVNGEGLFKKLRGVRVKLLFPSHHNHHLAIQ